MVSVSYFFGFEETLGPHVILSNIFWWASFILIIAAYRNMQFWNVGNMPWAFLAMTFLFFGIRELGHFSQSPMIASIRYVFGTISAIFMASALLFIYIKLFRRKTISKIIIVIPFIIALIFPIFLIYLYYSRDQFENIRNILFTVESIVWITGSVIIIYTTYMVGTKSTGGFVHVFMFFQFSAFFAILWKSLGLIGIISCPVPYSIREILETLFGVCAIISMLVLEKMLRNLSKSIS